MGSKKNPSQYSEAFPFLKFSQELKNHVLKDKPLNCFPKIVKQPQNCNLEQASDLMKTNVEFSQVDQNITQVPSSNIPDLVNLLEVSFYYPSKYSSSGDFIDVISERNQMHIQTKNVQRELTCSQLYDEVEKVEPFAIGEVFITFVVVAMNVNIENITKNFSRI